MENIYFHGSRGGENEKDRFARIFKVEGNITEIIKIKKMYFSYSAIWCFPFPETVENVLSLRFRFWFERMENLHLQSIKQR